ncbi:MAG: hypothetical protein HOY78_30245 [Saccharothrix sp.]|jgi:hypothetical protein|nr:hypothetical protein [Saccharothrix sp.]NUT96316.1 hypothetical protein [Saccharothrix sp.]
MVSFAALRDADPAAWKSAADDWVTLARHCEQSAADIYRRGSAALDDSWRDAVGDLATDRLAELANEYQAAGITIRGVAMTLEGLGEAAETTKRGLLAAVEYARAHGLTVDETTGAAYYAQAGPYTDDQVRAHTVANTLIGEALVSATRIDQEASAELAALARATEVTDLDEANRYQSSAARNQLDLYREALPIGLGPEAVRAWWDALSPQDRAEFERAVPVELHDLDGIPEDVKDRLRGDNGYNAVEAVRWARENWDDLETDRFEDNCANFVSHTLHQGGGLPMKTDAFGGTLNGENWASDSGTGIDQVDRYAYLNTPSWAQAETQRQFFLDNGGQEVPLSEARPGDVVYWVQEGGGHTTIGEAHHAAVVTGVTPDGDVHYTQHTDPAIDESLNGGTASYDVSAGQQRVVVVRPRQTW